MTHLLSLYCPTFCPLSDPPSVPLLPHLLSPFWPTFCPSTDPPSVPLLPLLLSPFWHTFCPFTAPPSVSFLTHLLSLSSPPPLCLSPAGSLSALKYRSPYSHTLGLPSAFWACMFCPVRLCCTFCIFRLRLMYLTTSELIFGPLQVVAWVHVINPLDPLQHACWDGQKLLS